MLFFEAELFSLDCKVADSPDSAFEGEGEEIFVKNENNFVCVLFDDAPGEGEAPPLDRVAGLEVDFFISKTTFENLNMHATLQRHAITSMIMSNQGNYEQN